MVYAAVIKLGRSRPTDWLDDAILGRIPAEDLPPPPPPPPDRETWGMTPEAQQGMAAVIDLMSGGEIA